MSILSEARQKVQDKNEEKKKTAGDKLVEDNVIRQNIIERFLVQVYDSPIAFELLCEYYSLVPDWNNIDYKVVPQKLFNWSNCVDFFEEDIGHVDFPLMQESRGGCLDCFYVYNAWAVRFINVYGMDIYFIPYSERERGFAVTVLDPRDIKHFFPRDIPNSLAVDWVTEYLLKNQ